MTTFSNTESTPENSCDGIEQTLHILKLVIAQIEMSVTESDPSSKTLSRSCEAMASNTQKILSQWIRVSNRCGDTQTASQVRELCGQFCEDSNDNVVAIQSQDRLIQRLKQIQHSLNCLTTLLVKPSLENSYLDWQLTRNEIHASNTMEENRALLTDASINPSIACYHTEQQHSGETETDPV